MKYLDKVRANEFDALVGERQTLLSSQLGVGDSILDIGCGVGQFTPLFLYKFKRVVGLDPSEKYLKEARKEGWNIEYVQGYGETFSSTDSFDTINMTNLLEHVDDPVKLLKNCKKHLNNGGRVIAQVPNANSITRRIGVEMGIIDSIEHMSEKEIEFWGHQRTYTLEQLEADFKKAGLEIIKSGGLLLKPLPNDMLWDICKGKGQTWTNSFIDALISVGTNPQDCAQIYVCAG